MRSQKQSATKWLLINQTDHAALAGEMARNLASPDFPVLDEHVLQAIALHDDGWRTIDHPLAPHSTRARPLSFFEEAPSDIFRAWNGSIARATAVAPISGILVSEHFCRIARDFARAPGTPPETAQVLTAFVEREIARQEGLRAQQSREPAEINLLVDVLQFFDLLSLYACSGSREAVEFPQGFNRKTFRLRREQEGFRMEPEIFNQAVFSLQAHRFPGSTTTEIQLIFGGGAR
jgi:hypothetical protein